jgi:hypothetical protein
MVESPVDGESISAKFLILIPQSALFDVFSHALGSFQIKTHSRISTPFQPTSPSPARDFRLLRQLDGYKHHAEIWANAESTARAAEHKLH